MELKETNLGIIALISGFLSFIPLIGVVFAVIAIVIGLRTRETNNRLCGIGFFLGMIGPFTSLVITAVVAAVFYFVA
ncbi:hypothetical protein JXC34_01520 [Candidatus Woesearchaeota archaeon]|nr:hypothetical protein [Candidatus Woesearchaeota archaeon]